jgi:hypothetical protein
MNVSVDRRLDRGVLEAQLVGKAQRRHRNAHRCERVDHCLLDGRHDLGLLVDRIIRRAFAELARERGLNRAVDVAVDHLGQGSTVEHRGEARLVGVLCGRLRAEPVRELGRVLILHEGGDHR